MLLMIVKAIKPVI